MADTAKKKPTGTKTTEIIIGQSATNLQRGLESLRKLSSDLEQFVTHIEQITLKVADLEVRIEKLTSEFNEKRRSAEVTFQNDMKQFEMETVNMVLESQNKVAISDEEHRGYQTLRAEFDKKVAEAVNSRVQSLSLEHKNQLELLKANNERDNAQKDAQVLVLKDKIDMLQSQVVSYENMITENRKAETERAKASAQFIPVTTPSGTR